MFFSFGSDNQLFRCLHYFPTAILEDYKEVLQHSGSVLGTIILRGTFRRISQLWDNAHLKLGLSSLFTVYNITIS